MKEEFDVAVIGGGPGGYVAAIRAAQLGGNVVLIEKNKLGGVCNNYGCIPSKTMIRLAEIQSNISIAEQFGINIVRQDIDYKQLMSNRKTLLDKLAYGIEILLKSNGIKLIFGTAEIKSRNEISVSTLDRKISFNTGNIIIATGSSGTRPKFFSENKNVISSEDILSSSEIPEEVLIIGGGPEGVEFSSMLVNFGSKVTIVEMLDRILPQEDKEVSLRMEKILRDNGITIFTNTKVLEIKDEGISNTVKLSSGEILNVDKILASTGRKPNTHSMGLEGVGVRLDQYGRIVVNDKMATSVKGVYAIGDVTGGRYAHEAMQHGIVAAENSMKLNSSMKNQVIPRCIYSIPEIACIGLTEDEAKKKFNILVGKFYLKASGRAMTLGDTNGFAKVVIDKKTRKFLGIHLINERASDMVGEALLALRYLKSDDVIDTIHPHPTLVESIKEATLDAYGIAIHSLNRNKKSSSKNLKHFAEE